MLHSKKAVNNEISETGKRFHLRVSRPYGYYPEDVDNLLLNQEVQIEQLQKENTVLTQRNADITKELEQAKTEIVRTRFNQNVILPDEPEDDTKKDGTIKISLHKNKKSAVSIADYDE